MNINKLYVENLRTIHQQAIYPSSKLNIITGGNGSGKSTLLEAITILLSGRSFRTAKGALLMQKSTGDTKNVALPLLITAEIQRESLLHNIGYRRDSVKKRVVIREDRRPITKASILAFNYPHLVSSPDITDIIDNGSERRRSYLDWVLFQTMPNSHQLFKNYRRALEQRNSLLRNWNSNQVRAIEREIVLWDEALDDAGQAIDHMRKGIMAELCVELTAILRVININININMQYHQGWEQGRSLLTALRESRTIDQRRHFTSKGPHRADVILLASDYQSTIKDICSRGEKKLINIALVLAQMMLINRLSNKRTILLIDDFYAEFDAVRITSLLNYIYSLGMQVFITTPRIEDLALSDDIADKKVFQLQQGVVSEMV